MLTATELINYYQMLPHPEGGYYKETYRSNLVIPQESLKDDFSGDRNVSTAIYYLLEKGQSSAFHKIKSDECWHFYLGDTLHIYVLHENGQLEIIKLGSNLLNGEVFQAVVPANCWFASMPAFASKFSFVGCTVAPGFDFNDFEIAKCAELCERFPYHAAIIETLCKH